MRFQSFLNGGNLMWPNLFVKDKNYVIILPKSVKIKSWIIALLFQFDYIFKNNHYGGKKMYVSWSL